MKILPTTSGERIVAIDYLRGFALLGIFIANMLLYHTPYLYIDPYSFFTSGDEETFKWIDIFVQGSFYPIFALLFGYGLNMQYEKSIERGVPFAKLMTRRLGILLLFGLVHALLIWSGDILFTYALMGFLLVLLIRIPAKWLVPLSVLLYVLPISLFYVLLRFMMKLDPNAVMGEYADIHQIELSISAFAHGSFSEIFMFRFSEWLIIGLGGMVTGFFIVLPIILLGAALSKWKVIERAHEFKGRLIVIIIVGLGAGIWIKSLPYLLNPGEDNQLLQDTFGGVLVAAAYVAIILLLCMLPIFRKLFSPIAKAGQMSLTTYIFQSIIATTIFYSYGFGLYGKVDLMTGTWIAIGVFVIQAIFAELWLSKFRMGPLEWVWRQATYRKISRK